MKKDLIQTFKILLAAVILSFGISYVYAWTAPTVAPPSGNTPAPLNEGPSAQIKTGPLTIKNNFNANEIGTNGLNPKVGIPTGWGGGIHTWDVYAEGTVGVGKNGQINASMNNAGNISAIGNITAGTFVSAGTLLANNITANNNITSKGSITASSAQVNGNLKAASLTASGSVSALNAAFGKVSISGNVGINGNVNAGSVSTPKIYFTNGTIQQSAPSNSGRVVGGVGLYQDTSGYGNYPWICYGTWGGAYCNISNGYLNSNPVTCPVGSTARITAGDGNGSPTNYICIAN